MIPHLGDSRRDPAIPTSAPWFQPRVLAQLVRPFATGHAPHCTFAYQVLVNGRAWIFGERDRPVLIEEPTTRRAQSPGHKEGSPRPAGPGTLDERMQGLVPHAFEDVQLNVDAEVGDDHGSAVCLSRGGGARTFIYFIKHHPG